MNFTSLIWESIVLNMNRVVLFKEDERQEKIFSFCIFSGCFQNNRLTSVSSVLPSVCFFIH